MSDKDLASGGSDTPTHQEKPIRADELLALSRSVSLDDPSSEESPTSTYSSGSTLTGPSSEMTLTIPAGADVLINSMSATGEVYYEVLEPKVGEDSTGVYTIPYVNRSNSSEIRKLIVSKFFRMRDAGSNAIVSKELLIRETFKNMNLEIFKIILLTTAKRPELPPIAKSTIARLSRTTETRTVYLQTDPTLVDILNYVLELALIERGSRTGYLRHLKKDVLYVHADHANQQFFRFFAIEGEFKGSTPYVAPIDYGYKAAVQVHDVHIMEEVCPELDINNVPPQAIGVHVDSWENKKDFVSSDLDEQLNTRVLVTLACEALEGSLPRVCLQSLLGSKEYGDKDTVAGATSSA